MKTEVEVLLKLSELEKFRKKILKNYQKEKSFELSSVYLEELRRLVIKIKLLKWVLNKK